MELFNRLPLDLAMMLTDDPEASAYFANLPQAQQKEIMSRAHEMNTVQEMKAYVQQLCRRA